MLAAHADRPFRCSSRRKRNAPPLQAEQTRPVCSSSLLPALPPVVCLAPESNAPARAHSGNREQTKNARKVIPSLALSFLLRHTYPPTGCRTLLKRWGENGIVNKPQRFDGFRAGRTLQRWSLKPFHLCSLGGALNSVRAVGIFCCLGSRLFYHPMRGKSNGFNRFFTGLRACFFYPLFPVEFCDEKLLKMNSCLCYSIHTLISQTA